MRSYRSSPFLTSGVLGSILLLTLTGCGKPAPKIGPLRADPLTGEVTVDIDPNQTLVTRVVTELGTRPTFNNASAVTWTDTNVLTLSPDTSGVVSLPAQHPFKARFLFGRDFPLFDGQIIDVQFKLSYRRQGDNTDLAFWSQRASFAAFNHVVATTDKCVFRYRRSTGPLESDANMPEEQATTHHFVVPDPAHPSTNVTASSAFNNDGQNAGHLRSTFDDCSTEHPCFGNNGRNISNPGRNIVNIKLSSGLEHLDPGTSKAVHGDIQSIGCDIFHDPQDIIQALCRVASSEPACASQH